MPDVMMRDPYVIVLCSYCYIVMNRVLYCEPGSNLIFLLKLVCYYRTMEEVFIVIYIS